MEIVDALEKDRSWISVTFRSGSKYWLLSKELISFPLQEGMEVDEKEFRRFLILSQYPRALDRAVAMLAGRPCSRAEIQRKLSSLHIDEEVVALVLAKLEKEKLLDDQEFSSLWVQSRARKYGISRLHRELRSKGVDEETVQSALSEISDEAQLADAVALARKKLANAKPGEDPRKNAQRILGFLIRRGYDWETARSALKAASGND
ncbi:MAG: regulatory protein RecX [Clostridia bacterium]|nr:regulatory protein RecX [Clostridia bacterium]